MRRRDFTLAMTALAVAGPVSAQDASLDARLREGGLVILMRHARTDPGVGDPPGFRLTDCTTQRNLSESGRISAVATGKTWREAGWPIAVVHTSAWCRCRDTAMLLELGPVTHLSAIDSFFEGHNDRREQTQALQAFIAGWRGAGNAVLVTHQVNIAAATGQSLGMGDALVVSPNGTVIAQLPSVG